MAKWVASMAIALGATLCLATQATAQFEINYPDTPPAEGETLLEWARPPVLDYTIPAQQRDDLSSCDDEAYEWELDRIALTCQPILDEVKLFTLASFAQGEPSGDRFANQREAIAYSDELLDLIGRPRWPMEELLRTKALETRLAALTELQDWDAAVITARDLVSSVDSDQMRHDNFRRGFAHKRLGDVLIQLGRSEEARADLNIAWALFDGPEGDKVGWPLSNYSENVIKDAIKQGDLDYAQQAVDRFLTHIRQSPESMQFGITEHLDLGLYLAAADEDVPTVSRLLSERLEHDDCVLSGPLFPAVLAPLRANEEVIGILASEHGCKPNALATMAAAAQNGIRDRKRDLILTYPADK